MAPRLVTVSIVLGLTLLAAVFADVWLTMAQVRRPTAPLSARLRRTVTKPHSEAPPDQPGPSSLRASPVAAGSPAPARRSIPPVPPPSKVALVGADASYDVTYEAAYRNDSHQPEQVHLQLPLAASAAPQQTVGHLRTAPLPSRLFHDGWQNPMAEFAFPRLAPGGVARAQVTARVTCRLEMMDLDARKVSTPSSNDRLARRFLGPAPGLPADAPGLLRKSASVVGGESSPWFKLIRLYDFVRSLDFRLDDRPQDVRAALASGRVQCSDAAQVLVTLARSVGLPSRYVGGFYHRDDDPETFRSNLHAWAEVFLPPYGWLPVDPTMARFDDSVRLSRLAQIMPGYVALWYGTPEVARAFLRRVGGRASTTRVALRFKVHPVASHPASPLLAARLGLELASVLQAPRPIPSASDAEAGTRSQEALGRLARGDAAGARQMLRLVVLRAPTAWAPQGAMVDVAAKDGTLDGLRSGYLSPRADKFHIPRWIQLDMAGLVDLRQQRYGAAQGELEAAVALPCGAPAWHNLATFYVRTRQVSRAADAFRQSLLHDPTAADTWQDLIGMYAGLEIWECVARTSEAAESILPTRAEFPTESGQAWFRLQRYPAAAKAFRRALALRPGSGWLHAMLGWTLQETGHRQEGHRELQRGVALGITGPDRPFFENLAR